MANKIILFALSNLLLTGFFMLPDNRKWLQQRVLPYWKQMGRQAANLDIEHRKVLRYKDAYVLSKWAADSLAKKLPLDSVLLLVPSTAYFESRGVQYHVPEPAVFYYFTGLRTVWPGSVEARKANWWLRAENGKLVIERPPSGRALQDSLSFFNQFPPSL
ncbi:MAG TPA: hypothetical protein VFR58_04910 [Flavisolibacter sp.]|nr:hypothetical protein [Flavisolibacter sp.]